MADGSFNQPEATGYDADQRSALAAEVRFCFGIPVARERLLFGAFAGPGPRQFAASHHWTLAVAYLVGLAQVAGGFAILSGILFRLGAASVLIIMVGANFVLHLPHGFDVSNGGIEYALTQLLLAAALLLTGPGEYSLTYLLPRSLQRL